jgi:hypothetical protein
MSDNDLMTTALAMSLRQTFTGLLAMPARLGDIEPRETPAAAAGGDDVPPVAAVPVSARKGRTPAASRARARKLAPAVLAAAAAGGDWF